MSTYFKNFLGLRCTDLELLQVPNPEVELTIQVTMKTVQCGTLIGSLIVAPLSHFLYDDSSNKPHSLQSAVTRSGLLGAAVGLLAGPVISAIWMQKLNTVQRFDRCYRLRFNKKHINVDRCAMIAACAGSAIDGGHGFVLGVDMALLTTFLFTGRSPFSFNIDF